MIFGVAFHMGFVIGTVRHHRLRKIYLSANPPEVSGNEPSNIRWVAIADGAELRNLKQIGVARASNWAHNLLSHLDSNSPRY